MAALCGLKILLLWAGIISLAKSPPPPLCSYTVTVTDSEFQLNITSSTAGKYSFNINEEGQPETMKFFTFEHHPQTSSHEITHLKPCIVYEHSVTFIDSNDEETPCDSGGDKILMNTMDLKIINTKTTNTSIDLSWNTTSQNCQDDLPNLQGLSYDCNCFSSDQKHSNEVNKHIQANGGTCHVAGLEPYTNYTCEIQPTYNNKKVRQSTVVKQRTEIGMPEDITGMVTISEHNVIRVTCTHKNRLNGPEEKYIARLFDGSFHLEKMKANNCEFEFKDLNYSTSYRLEMTVFNGKFESKPKTQDVVTLHSSKGVFIVVFFVIFIITLAVAVCVLKCRKSRNDVNEDVILESTAVR